MHDNGAEQLYTSIHTIYRKLRRIPEPGPTHMKGLPPITKVQWWILRTVWKQKQCTAGYLAKEMGVRPSTMSQMLDRLEKAGFITRLKDSVDGRVRIIRLTDMGQNIFHRSEAWFVQKLVDSLNLLTPQKQQTLIRLMEELAAPFSRQNDH